MFKAETNIRSNIDTSCCAVPLKTAVVLATKEGNLDLWKSEFSECLRRCELIGGMTNVIAVSENNVVCTGPGISGTLIVDTITEGKDEIKARNLTTFMGHLLHEAANVNFVSYIGVNCSTEQPHCGGIYFYNNWFQNP